MGGRAKRDRVAVVMRALRLVRLAAIALALGGCAALHHPRRPPAPAPPVTIESRPTPPPPESTAVRRARRARLLTPRAASALRAQALRDTLAAGARLRRCAGRGLLPDRQNTWDAATGLLAQAHAALLRGDAAGARTFAREARQLAADLDCP